MNCKTVINNRQHEFSMGKLPLMNLIDWLIIVRWTDSIDEGRVVNVIYFDFGRAFPKVFDSILLVKIVR